jgi:hypothetical protein
LEGRFFLVVLLLVGGLGYGLFQGFQDQGALKRPALSGGALLVADGRTLFYGKGRCGLCHTIGVERGGKCPNLDGAGERLTREFIVEAMINPSAYVRLDYDPPRPKPYPARMPVMNRSPVSLTEQEIQSVVLFVQGVRY